MIGLGKMGQSMARNIMKSGFDMVLFDLRPEALDDLIQEGALRADSIRSLGEQVDTVLMMVNTYAQCRSCLLELVEGMRGGTVIVCSTISMEEVRQLETIALSHGLNLLDAPVSGGTAGALHGTLTIMVGGAAEVYQQCLPLFQSFGNNPVHVGERVGSGQAMKAVNQLLVGINLCATAEAFHMARRCGLDLNLVFSTIKASAGTSRIFENRGQFLIDRNFDTRSTLSIQLKDTDIACQTAQSVGAPALLGNVSRQLYAQALSQYDPNEDSIAVIKLLEALSGDFIEG